MTRRSQPSQLPDAPDSTSPDDGRRGVRCAPDPLQLLSGQMSQLATESDLGCVFPVGGAVDPPCSSRGGRCSTGPRRGRSPQCHRAMTRRQRPTPCHPAPSARASPPPSFPRVEQAPPRRSSRGWQAARSIARRRHGRWHRQSARRCRRRPGRTLEVKAVVALADGRQLAHKRRRLSNRVVRDGRHTKARQVRHHVARPEAVLPGHP